VASMFKSPQQRLNAEETLREGSYKGSYTASGYMLLIDRLDQVIEILNRAQSDKASRS
jgi:hypothetical protein